MENSSDSKVIVPSTGLMQQQRLENRNGLVAGSTMCQAPAGHTTLVTSCNPSFQMRDLNQSADNDILEATYLGSQDSNLIRCQN